VRYLISCISEGIDESSAGENGSHARRRGTRKCVRKELSLRFRKMRNSAGCFSLPKRAEDFHTAHAVGLSGSICTRVAGLESGGAVSFATGKIFE